jgi:hypothetical protein
MNTRGLMELIVLNIGYDLGILGPEIFAMMVIMALVTTFMTGPTLSFINWAFKEPEVLLPTDVNPVSKDFYKVLISFGLASSGRKLLRLADQLTGHTESEVRITAVHVTPSSDVSLLNVSDFENQSFRPIRSEADKLKIPLDTRYKLTTDLHREVIGLIEKEEFNLLLIGAGKSLYSGSLLGNIVGVTKALSPENLLGKITGNQPLFRTDVLIDDKARQFVNDAPCDVGVLLDREFSDSGVLFVPVFSEEDAFLLNYARKFMHNNKSTVTIMDASGLLKGESIANDKYNRLKANFPNQISTLKERAISKEFLTQQELMLISYKSWTELVESKSVWLENVPSVLVLRSLIQFGD